MAWPERSVCDVLMEVSAETGLGRSLRTKMCHERIVGRQVSCEPSRARAGRVVVRKS